MWGSHCCLATALFTYSWNAALSPEGKKDNPSKRILRMKALPLAGKVVAETMCTGYKMLLFRQLGPLSAPVLPLPGRACHSCLLWSYCGLVFVSSCFLLSCSSDQEPSPCTALLF